MTLGGEAKEKVSSTLTDQGANEIAGITRHRQDIEALNEIVVTSETKLPSGCKFNLSVPGLETTFDFTTDEEGFSLKNTIFHFIPSSNLDSDDLQIFKNTALKIYRAVEKTEKKVLPQEQKQLYDLLFDEQVKSPFKRQAARLLIAMLIALDLRNQLQVAEKVIQHNKQNLVGST